MPARSGIGTTVAFAVSSSYTPQVRSFQGLGITREMFDTTHMESAASATYPGIIMREYTPGDLGAPEQITLGILFDPDETPDIPIDGDPEEVTITFRALTGQSYGATMVFDAFAVSWSAGDINYEGLMEGTVVLQPTGDIVITAGA